MSWRFSQAIWLIPFAWLTIVGCTGSPVKQALILSRIEKADSLETKINKTLALLNEKRYFQQKPPPVELPAPFDNPYNLDSLRSPDEILSQKIGGYAGSAARSFVAILHEAGVPKENLQIVASVISPDLKVICPKAGESRMQNPESEGRGHVFVAVKLEDNQWEILNPVDASVHYERATWMDPQAVKEKIQKEPVEIPKQVYLSLPFRTFEPGLVVYQTWSLDEIPKYSFEQRFDLIASGVAAGDPSIRRCRFTAPTKTASRQ